MKLSTFAALALVVAPTAKSTLHFDFIDDDAMNPLHNLGQETHTTSIHIILDGVTTPLNAEELHAVNEAFKETYNDIYGADGFHMENIEIMEQEVHGPNRKFLRTPSESDFQPDQENYLSLVANLQGTSSTSLGVFGDADYRAMMQRFWERKACQVILTGNYSPAELRLCFMTRPRRRSEMIEETDDKLQLDSVMS
jgi:hypothetical protein